MTSGQRFALGSFFAGCLVLSLKAAAWWLTGSAALYSDALESIVNVAASLIAWTALRFAARPPDANHPFGHDKVEFFAAVIEGVLIVVAALLIFAEAWQGWMHVRPLEAPIQGIGLNAVATIINGAWSGVLLAAGRRLRSPTLDADGRHPAGGRRHLDWNNHGRVFGGLHRRVPARPTVGRADRGLRPVVRDADDLHIRQRPDGRSAGTRRCQSHQGARHKQCRRRNRSA